MKLLLHLKKFEGDGKMHEIEHLFPELPLSEKTSIFKELAEENFIILKGREPRYYSHIVDHNILTGETKVTESPLNEIIDKTEPEKFKAKITFKGTKYLKEEIEMQDKGKYNINVSGEGANNTFVIESNHVKIENKPEFKNQIDQIIEILNSDNSMSNSLKQKAINDFQIAKKEINNNGKLSENIMKALLKYGAEISSIGSLVLQLFAS